MGRGFFLVVGRGGALIALLLGCSTPEPHAIPVPAGMSTPDLRTIIYPDDQPPTVAQVELGRRLFFDRRLSSDGRQACATCHQPEHGLSDGRRTAAGVSLSPSLSGTHKRRNAPGLTNVAWGTVFFADGRATSLEQQAIGPLTDPEEMNLTPDAIVPLLATDPTYRYAFATTYANGLVLANVLHAIAAFERTLISRDAPFDRYLAGDQRALTPQAQRGMATFVRVGCMQCHRGPNFTNESFINTGLRDQSDRGRGAIVAGATLEGAFKTPTLRNVALTAPYFHDGSLATLAEVVAFYNRGGDAAPKDPLIRPLGMNAAEQADLVAFLEALTEPIPVRPPPPPVTSP